jgi:hypothetical protein
MLQILKAKLDRAARQEQVARLVNLKQPDKAAPVEQDWVNAARALKCPPENLIAVIQVESGGTAFNAEGRLVIAYEPHVFSRNTKPKHAYLKSHPHLATSRFVAYSSVPPSKRSAHPMGMSQEARWMLLAEAAELDFYAGTSACSYGMWQILGINAEKLGFTDPMHMIEVMYEGHDGQWECFIRYCKWAGCLTALVKGDWDTFERLYNGGGHKGAYARKLAHHQSQARKALA